MNFLQFCFDWWNKGGAVNYVILASVFFISLFFFNKNFSKSFTNNMIGVVPLLGLLGTVVGMVDMFESLKVSSASAQGLAGGISKAMITTCAGLCVAIIGTILLPLKKD